MQRSMTSLTTISFVILQWLLGSSVIPTYRWCILHFRRRPFPNSLPTPTPIPVISTWRRQATGLRLRRAAPDLPLIGFARRMTEYKRAGLLFEDVKRLAEIARRQ